jgi:hypothetical protein
VTRSTRLCISCTQTELPPLQQRALINHWCDLLPTLDRVRLLQFDSQVPQKLFDAACHMPNLEALWIKWSSIRNLEQIRGNRALRHLHIGGSAQIQSIVPLGEMTSLKSLSAENLKHITDLDPLSALTRLEELAISGGMWGHQKVKTLAPLAELRSLRWLHLGGVRSLDESLKPLGALRQLRFVFVNLGNYPIEELAWLSVRFAKIKHGVRPYSDFDGKYAFLPCRKCSNRTMVLLLGKGQGRSICKDCDAEKLAAHVDYFNDCVAACFSSARD